VVLPLRCGLRTRICGEGQAGLDLKMSMIPRSDIVGTSAVSSLSGCAFPRTMGSGSRSPSCSFQAAPSASEVAYPGETKSRHDFPGSGIWEGPSSTDGVGGPRR
jgi:hypothetical protein